MTIDPQILLSRGVLNDKAVVFIDFKFDWKIVDRLKSYKHAVYLPDDKRWYIKNEVFDLMELKKHFGEKFHLSMEETERHSGLFTQYKNKLIQKRYSDNTIRTYCKYFSDFVIHFSHREPNTIKKEEINTYILELIKKKNISTSQQNQRINAIKFYYEKVLGFERSVYEIERPIKEKQLPDVLSKEEIGSMLECTTNLKHKTIVSILYSCGLRRSEATNLSLSDIDSNE